MKKTAHLIVFKLFLLSLLPGLIIWGLARRIFSKRDSERIGILNIEFFHKSVGAFGGFGANSKNIIDYYLSKAGSMRAFDVLLTRKMAYKKPVLEHYDNAEIIVLPNPESPRLRDIFRYALMINRRNYRLILTTDYNGAYFYTLFLLPVTPVIFWIRDPWSDQVFDKINTLSYKFLKTGEREREIKSEYEKSSLRKIIHLSKLVGRRFVFGSTCKELVERARQAYGQPEIEPLFLPTPIRISKSSNGQRKPDRPRALFLGRLDPIKRPWIFFELARRFPQIDFFVAGNTHFPKLMDPVINRFKNVPNLKFLGLVTGKQKQEVLKSSICLINTSIHEGLPVTFLEAFSFGKPVISCINPDELVSRFGIYVGDIIGDGNEEAVDKFAQALSSFIQSPQLWEKKGALAREFIKENYSFDNFTRIFNRLLYNEDVESLFSWFGDRKVSREGAEKHAI